MCRLKNRTCIVFLLLLLCLDGIGVLFVSVSILERLFYSASWQLDFFLVFFAWTKKVLIVI